ncbi:MAG: 2Fe-2S iron-sulfur cluster-binding protein, partial [Fusobacteriaceae bacterium]
MIFEIEIDGVLTSIESHQTILERCLEIGINIPTLCHHEDLGTQKVCGVCLVECNGEFIKSCESYPQDGMVIKTKTPLIEEKRKIILENMMSNHPNNCLTCEKSQGDCQLQDLCYDHDVINRNTNEIKKYEIDNSSSGLTRDLNKCILCEKCVAVCQEFQGIAVYKVIEKNGVKEIGIRGGELLKDSKCIACGQCVKVCPVGALTEK